MLSFAPIFQLGLLRTPPRVRAPPGAIVVGIPSLQFIYQNLLIAYLERDSHGCRGL